MQKRTHPLLVLGLLFMGFLAPFQSAEALTVSPVRVELTGNPGETLVADIRLLNEQEKTITFYFSAENFEAQGEDGTPNFVAGDTGLASWISLLPEIENVDPNTVTLEASETVSRTFAIKIPEDASPGGHFAAIFFGDAPPGDSGGVAVGAKVGILVLLTVSGEFEESGDLLSFGTVDEQTSFESLPVVFEYRFQNEGADRVVPSGTIEITNLFGMSSEEIVANSAQSNVLPMSIRRFEENWGTVEDETAEKLGFWDTVKNQWSDFAFGPYKATLNLTYGSDPVTVTKAVDFWVFPWQLLLVATGALLISLLVVGTFIRLYNRWIVGKALKAFAQINKPKKDRKKR
jgi:hypothetical protein